MKEYVYILTHVATGKKYVGKTSNPKSRKASHLNMLRVGHHSCKALQDDYNNLGKEIKFEVVCENTLYRRSYDTEKELMIRLQTYDEKHGYNANDWSMNPIRRANGLPYKASNRKGKSIKHRVG